MRCSAKTNKNLSCKNGIHKEDMCYVHFLSMNAHLNKCEVCWDETGKKYCVCTGILCKDCFGKVRKCPFCRKKFIKKIDNFGDFLSELNAKFYEFQLNERGGEEVLLEIICDIFDFLLCKEHAKFWNDPMYSMSSVIKQKIMDLREDSTVFRDARFDYYYNLYEQFAAE